MIKIKIKNYIFKDKDEKLHFSQQANDFGYLTPGLKISNQGPCPFSVFFSASLILGGILF